MYYQTHLTCPDFRASGYALPGVPGMPHFTHTEHVGWGMTHGFGDYQDLYIERFRTVEGRLQYLSGEEWIDADAAEQIVEVRGADAESLSVVRTRHGPIIAGDPAQGYGLAFCHTGTRTGTPWLDTVHGLLLAQSADEAEEALREWTEPVNNFVYADVHGEFGYRYRGRIPRRSMANAWTPGPGWTGEHEWDEQIPFDELPAARNPAQGFVVTCNNAPTTADYPHYINTFFAADWRARRITAALEGMTAGDVDAMAEIHADRQSIPAGIFIDRVARLAPTDPFVAMARDVLVAWTGSMDRESIAPTIYSAARAHLFMAVTSHQLGPMAVEAVGGADAFGRGATGHAGQLFAEAVTAMAADDTSVLPDGASWDTVVETALAAGLEELKDRLGDSMDEWQWGTVHHTQPRHPLSRAFPQHANLLDPPGIATHGDADTPLAGGYTIGERYVQTLMSVNRYIHDPSDWTKSRWIVPLGASGHPGSAHYADQAAAWAQVETVAQLWKWQDIESAAETEQILAPAED